VQVIENIEKSPGIGFDPHRPYQSNRLNQNVLSRVRFLVYLWCTLPIRPDTTAKLDLPGSLTSRIWTGIADSRVPVRLNTQICKLRNPWK